jgi:hypothetical protein
MLARLAAEERRRFNEQRKGGDVVDLPPPGETLWCVRHAFVLPASSPHQGRPRPAQGGPVPGCPSCQADLEGPTRPERVSKRESRHSQVVGDEVVDLYGPKTDREHAQVQAIHEAMEERGMAPPGSQLEYDALRYMDSKRRHAEAEERYRNSKRKSSTTFQPHAPWQGDGKFREFRDPARASAVYRSMKRLAKGRR